MKKKKKEEKHTILSYVDPYKATSDQYVFSWPSAEIQAGQSHFLKAGVSDKPIREQKHSYAKSHRNVSWMLLIC